MDEIKEHINEINKKFELIKIFEQGEQALNKPFLLVDNTKKQNNSSQSENLKITENKEMKIKGITIHKTKNCNTWYTRYRDNGKQYFISAKTQKECYNKLKEQLNIISKEKKPKHYTLQSWYEKWIELFKINKVKNSSLESYKSLMKNIPLKILNKNIKLITSIEIQETLHKIDKERQREKVFIFLKDIFTKAYKHKIIQEDIFDTLEKPKHIKKKGKALNLQEQTAFINACKNSNCGDFFLIVLYQGLRKGEAMAILKRNIDFTYNTLSINKSVNRHNQLYTTKNIYSDRTMPLFKPTIEILKNYNQLNTDERLFKFNPKTLQENFKIILKNAGLTNDIRIHDLRHTFITNCKNSNIPEHIVQSWVGHQIGSKVTSSIYTHIDNNISNINANILDKFYSNSTQKKDD